MTPERRNGRPRAESIRGQANMVSLAIALLLLVGAAGTAIAIAHGSLASAEREPAERNVATNLADGLVSPDATHVRRENVLDRNETEALAVTDVETLAPGIDARPFRIRIDDRTLLERGDPTGGTRVERLVVLATDDQRTYRLDLEEDDAVTVPRRTDVLRVTVEPENDTTVSTIRVNDRVLLHDPDGLEGTATASVPWTATLRVTVEGEGSDGVVAITANPETTAKARLEVTVGAET